MSDHDPDDWLWRKATAFLDRSEALGRGPYRLVQAVRPSMVSHVVDRLLPEFAAAMEPFYAASVALAEERHHG